MDQMTSSMTKEASNAEVYDVTPPKQLPMAVDWRSQGYVSPVKYQVRAEMNYTTSLEIKYHHPII